MSYPLRLALIGKTGVGKSRFGNTVLNERVFRSSSHKSPVTLASELRNGMANQRSVSIVDTPGFNDTRIDNQDPILREITRGIYLSAPGLHAICFIFEIGRFTMEVLNNFKTLVRHFGESLYKYIIVVFTKYDDYKRNCEEEEIECDIHNYLNTLPTPVKDFVVTKCGSRVIGFDNTLKGEESKKQVIELLAMVDALVAKNGNSIFLNDEFKKVEEAIESKMKEEKRRVELKIKEEKRRMDLKMKEERSRMELEMKEERHRMELEMKEEKWRMYLEMKEETRRIELEMKEKLEKLQKDKGMSFLKWFR